MRILLYDGVCGLCDRFVSWVSAIDREHHFHFAPLQGKTAAAARERFPEIPPGLDTVVLLEGERVYLRSRAVFRVWALLPFPWPLLSVLRFLPVCLTDPFYGLVARVRYRLSGGAASCRLPAPEDRHRFLE